MVKDSLRSVDPPIEPGKTTIVLADDHPLIRQAVRSALEKEADFKIVAEAGDGKEAVKLAEELIPDVVIMDISMPNMNGLEATRQIKATHPNIAVLALTIHDEDEYILGILEAGAAGYLLKTIFSTELIAAVRSIVAGEMVLSPSIAPRLMKHAARRLAKPVPLGAGEIMSVREIEVLKLAAQGLSNKDIATELNLSLRTVKGYLQEIFSKLRVGSRTEAIITSLHAGIISLEDLNDF